MKKLMKRLFVYILFLLNFTSVVAAEANTLVLELKNGTKEMYQLDDKPVITFDSNNLYISSSKVYMKYYLFSNLSRYYFVDNGSSAIQSMQNDDVAFSFRYVDKDNVVLTGTDRAEVYSVDGKKLLDVVEQSDELNINLGDFPSGVYVIKTNNKSFKIRK